MFTDGSISCSDSSVRLPLPMAEVGDARMIVAVTYGRSSFVGRSVVAALLSNGRFTVRVIDSLPAPDLTPSLSPFFQSGRITYHHVDTRIRSPSLLTALSGAGAVFHVDPTVTTLQPQPARSSDFHGLHLLLVQSTRNLIAACWEIGVQRFVYIGSANVVVGPANQVHSWNESVEYPERFVDSLSELGAQVEAMVLGANKKDGFSTCALRVSNPFGPGDENLVPFLVQSAKKGWTKFIIGSGKNSWDFTYIENVAHASICAEQALRFRTPYVAGRPFFITNQQPMKFWDFLSNILEGLGYQRPNVSLPVAVVLALAEVVRFFQEKMPSYRTSNPVVAASTLQSFAGTKTFDCSNAERIFGYSPVVSLEDGINLTIASFSQLAKFSSDLDRQYLTSPSKAEKLLGNGSVANILLWRNDRKTFSCLLALFLLHYWLFLAERTFISSATELLMFLVLILFISRILPFSLFGISIENIVLLSLAVPETTLRKFFGSAASLWNEGICIVGTVAQGKDWALFLKAVGILYVFKLLLLFSLRTVSATGLICLFTFFIVYEQSEREVDSLVAASAWEFDRLKGFLLARLRRHATLQRYASAGAS